MNGGRRTPWYDQGDPEAWQDEDRAPSVRRIRWHMVAFYTTAIVACVVAMALLSRGGS